MHNRPRKVNQSLDQSPKIFGLPSEQIIPWITIAGGSYYIIKVLCNLSWIWVVVTAGWGISTFWILTGSKSWKFLSKFRRSPNWIRAVVRYHGLKHVKRKYKAKDR